LHLKKDNITGCKTWDLHI